MVQLPLCRWREENPKGYVCHSAKFLNPPNQVTAAFCAACTYADHEPLLKRPNVLPCVHLGTRVEVKAKRSRPGSKTSLSLFNCAIHGHCTIEEPDALTGRKRGSAPPYCGTCADYLGRDPFGPDSTQMLRRAEDFLATLPDYPTGRYQGRGVVIAGGGDRYFASLYVTVRALRHVGCKLPIQVWYLGNAKEMPAKRKALLAPFDVECVDADKVRRKHPARHLGGWQLKVFATLHSPFEEILFLDADCYPCRAPEFLFDLPDYRERGAIFWPDIATFDKRLKWPAFGVTNPVRPGSVESGQYVINKRTSWRPLNLAWFYNDNSDYYYRYGYGDKHTFEVAWTRCEQPFVMWQPQARWARVAYLHPGPDAVPLFIHRCSDKFRLNKHDYVTPQKNPVPIFHSFLPLERECWGWMKELARKCRKKFEVPAAIPHNRTSPRFLPDLSTTPYQVYEPRDAQGSFQAGSGRFAIATMYTSEFAAMGKMAVANMVAYAGRHGYKVIVATSKIDPSRAPHWSKLPLFEHYFLTNPGCEWLMWIDADAVITNPGIRLEDFVSNDVDFLFSEDLPPSPINFGVFFARNCPAALDLFQRAYAKLHFLDHPGREQAAVVEALGEPGEKLRYRILPRRRFNSFPFEHQEGDFIKHFAGWSTRDKFVGVMEAVATMARRQA